MKMNRLFFSAAATGLLLTACADPHDARIAALTRQYAEGRISVRRYHELCQVVNAVPQRSWGGWFPADSQSSSACDTTTTDTTTDHDKCDKKHERGQPSPPAPGKMQQCPAPRT